MGGKGGVPGGWEHNGNPRHSGLVLGKEGQLARDKALAAFPEYVRWPPGLRGD